MVPSLNRYTMMAYFLFAEAILYRLEGVTPTYIRRQLIFKFQYSSRAIIG
jgi:hypothetical protein